jgi:hypothetical protein
VHLLMWLHLVALGDHFADGFLVTLGEYRHLAGLEELEALAREGDWSWPPLVDL